MTLSIELSWLTPPAARVVEALSLPHALPYLQTLGVTETEQHHMLSFEILESLGVGIFESDYRAVLDRVRPLILATIAGPVAQAVSIAIAKSHSCNSTAHEA